jgi:hypothetical protein
MVKGIAATVLVVDDDAAMLSALERTLTRRGYHVLSANGPRQALEIFKSNTSIQLILSDIHMPGMRGTSTGPRSFTAFAAHCSYPNDRRWHSSRSPGRRSFNQEAFLYAGANF